MSLRHLTSLFLASLGCWLSLHAQNNSPMVEDLYDRPIRVIPVEYILWEISSPRLSEPSYLYGILYKVPANAFFIIPGLDQVIDHSDRLVMEVHPAEMDRDHLYRGTVPIDSTLEEILPKRQYQELKSFVEDSLSVSSMYKMSRRYQPLLLSQQFMCDFCLGFEQGDEPVNYEQYLYQTVDLPLTPLTNGWAREAWLDIYSQREQAAMLIETLTHKRRLCLNYYDLLKAYWAQNVESVWQLAREIPEFGSNTSSLIEARNAEWMDTLPQMMERERLLIAVHAVQLPGEYGLIHMLRKSGYELRPVVR